VMQIQINRTKFLAGLAHSRRLLRQMRISNPGRNDPCPCGSGRKFKRCCMGRKPTTFARGER
jgi:uncharacterized protein YecA (UPF0149 family)